MTVGIKPTRYFVEWDDPALVKREAERQIERARAHGYELSYDEALADVYPAFTNRQRDFSALSHARRFAKQVKGIVYERLNITDTTPNEDWTLGYRGLIWDFEIELIDDSAIWAS